jgi:hypothetical protein
VRSGEAVAPPDEAVDPVAPMAVGSPTGASGDERWSASTGHLPPPPFVPDALRGDESGSRTPVGAVATADEIRRHPSPTLPLILTGAAAAVILVVAVAVFALRPGPGEVATGDVGTARTTTTAAVRSGAGENRRNQESVETTIVDTSAPPASLPTPTAAPANRPPVGPAPAPAPGPAAPPSAAADPRPQTTEPSGPRPTSRPPLAAFPEFTFDFAASGNTTADFTPGWGHTLPEVHWTVAPGATGFKLALHYPPTGSEYPLALGSSQIKIICPVPQTAQGMCRPDDGVYGYDLVLTRLADGERRSKHVYLVVRAAPASTTVAR